MIKFNLRFTFWSKWTWESRPHATPVTSWLQASTLLISVGRLKAPFIVNSELVGVAAYKFRALSRNMLKMCVTQEGQFDDFFPPREQHAKCLPNCPREPHFPAGLFFMLKWNLAHTTIQLSRHDFYGNWHVCTCRCKSSRQLGSNRSSLVDGIRMQRRLLSTAGWKVRFHELPRHTSSEPFNDPERDSKQRWCERNRFLATSADSNNLPKQSLSLCRMPLSPVGHPVVPVTEVEKLLQRAKIPGPSMSSVVRPPAYSIHFLT